MKTYFLGLLSICALIALSASAQEQLDPRSAFKNVSTVTPPALSVPTVVGVPFTGVALDRNDFLVYEKETQQFLSWYFKEENSKDPINFSVSTNPPVSARALMDRDPLTAVDFALPEDRNGAVRITIAGSEPIRASSLYINLAKNVALPLTVEIRARGTDGLESIVVSERKVTGEKILFPVTEVREWIIDLTYGQPLRINEITFNDERTDRQVERQLRFLAQPAMTYEVYYNPDRNVVVRESERGNFATDEGVMPLSPIIESWNQRYTAADIDSDGIADLFDNCVSVANPNQEDIDLNGRGDACDDFDRDGIINSSDNCPSQTNRAQKDEDGDGVGDECDGVESRFTERNPWVPWVGMGIAALVLIALFALVALRPVGTEKKEDEEPKDYV